MSNFRDLFDSLLIFMPSVDSKNLVVSAQRTQNKTKVSGLDKSMFCKSETLGCNVLFYS